MPPICLLGAGGATGVLIAQRLSAQGREIIACGREPERVEARLSEVSGAVVDVRRVNVDEPSTLDAALAGAGCAVSTVGPYERLGRAVVDAVIRNRVHLIDVSGEAPYVRWVYERASEPARAAGVSLVPGAGFTGAIGHLLGAIAAREAGQGAEVHVAYTTLGGGRRSLTAGTRRSVAGLLGEPGYAYVDGVLVPEPLGEERRLAWFPRPVGPMHAAAVPGIEAVTLPHHADVATVRTYYAMSAWKAEAFQALGNASRWPPLRTWLAGRLDRDVSEPTASRREATRWACIAEARGERGLVRAWAYGRDPYGTAASSAVLVAGRLLDESAAGRTGPAGARPVAALIEPSVALDDLSVACGLRWSVVRGAA